VSYIFETLPKYAIKKVAVKQIRIGSLKLLLINRIVVLASADKRAKFVIG